MDQYVVIAPKRTHSIHHVSFPKTGELKSPPLENEASVLEIPGPNGRWDIKVIRNLFPAFSPGNKQAQGVQEVVLEGNPPTVPFAQLTQEQIEHVFSAYCQRIQALYKIKDVRYVSVFHNQGLEAGASIRQTHSQIIALASEPPDLLSYNDAYEKLKLHYGTSPLRKAMTWEQQRLARVVHNSPQVLAVAPYASMHPYEVWLVPWQPVRSICDLKPRERAALAQALKAVTLALESEQIPYNFHLVEGIRGRDNHFMIKVCPRPNVFAGFEMNTGITINPVSPEEAARWYRNYIKEHRVI